MNEVARVASVTPGKSKWGQETVLAIERATGRRNRNRNQQLKVHRRQLGLLCTSDLGMNRLMGAGGGGGACTTQGCHVQTQAHAARHFRSVAHSPTGGGRAAPVLMPAGLQPLTQIYVLHRAYSLRTMRGTTVAELSTPQKTEDGWLARARGGVGFWAGGKRAGGAGGCMWRRLADRREGQPMICYILEFNTQQHGHALAWRFS
jgi:hypothetical protein